MRVGSLCPIILLFEARLGGSSGQARANVASGFHFYAFGKNSLLKVPTSFVPRGVFW